MSHMFSQFLVDDSGFASAEYAVLSFLVVVAIITRAMALDG